MNGNYKIIRIRQLSLDKINPWDVLFTEKDSVDKIILKTLESILSIYNKMLVLKTENKIKKAILNLTKSI